jgi:hypothetical protein
MTFVRRNVFLFIVSVSYLSVKYKPQTEQLAWKKRMDRCKELVNIHLVILFSFILNLVVHEDEALRN